MAMTRGNECPSVLQFGFQVLSIVVVVVDQQDVEDVHVKLIEHGEESRIALGHDVSMAVNRLESGEALETSLMGECLRGLGSAGGGCQPKLRVQNDKGARDRYQNDNAHSREHGNSSTTALAAFGGDSEHG